MRESPVRGPAVDLSEFERRMRAPAQNAGGKSDPLSELARLMGENGEEDPYGHILPDPRAVRAEQRPAEPAPAAWEGDLRGAYPDTEPHAGDYHDYADAGEAAEYRGYEHDAAAGYDEQGYAASDYRDERPHQGSAEAEWGDESQYLDYGAEEEAGEESGGLRRYFRPWHAVAAISAIAIGSIAWGFAHRAGSPDSREIAVINAPEGPVKVKPAAEADQDTADASGAAVLDRKESVPVKQVVTHQEQAVDPTVAPKAVQLGDGPVDAPHEPAAAQPRKVKTVTIRPDGSRVDDAALPPAVTRDANPPADASAVRGGTPKAESRPATTPQATAKPKAPPKAPAKVAATESLVVGESEAPAPAATGGYAVQFGAAATEAEARTLVKTVSTKYGVKATYKPAQVGDRTVYRVRVAGVSKDSAAAICSKVKASGGNCFVASN